MIPSRKTVASSSVRLGGYTGRTSRVFIGGKMAAFGSRYLNACARAAAAACVTAGVTFGVVVALVTVTVSSTEASGSGITVGCTDFPSLILKKGWVSVKPGTLTTPR